MAERTAVIRPATPRRRGAGAAASVSALDRGWQSAVAGLVVVVLLLRLAFDSGGYFGSVHLEVGAVAFAATALLLAVRAPRYAVSTPALVAGASLLAFAAWAGLSSRWSPMPSTALEDMQRTLVYAALFWLGILAAGSGRYSRHLAWALLCALAVVTGTALLSRLDPSLVSPRDLGPLFAAETRLSHPLTYWNALGALAAIGIVLGAGLAADVRAHPAARGAAAGIAVVAGVAGYLTFSRGAWLAFFVGLIVLVVASPRRLGLFVTLVLVGGALAVAILRLQAYPSLLERGGQAGGYPALLALCVAGAVGVQAAVAITGRRVQQAVAPIRGRLLALGAGAAVLLAVGFYALQAQRVEGGTAQMLADVERFVEREWDHFMEPANFSAAGPERLRTARGTRSHVYGVALDGFRANPVWGEGAGAFEVRYAHDPDTQDKVRDAHSLYFETLSELGLVGLGLLLGFLGAVVHALVRARLRRGSLSRGQAAAVAAAFSVWLVHAGLDWDWQMPGLTGFAIVLAATAFPVGRRRGSRRRGPGEAPEPVVR